MQSVRESTQFKKLKWVLQPRKQGQPTKRWGHTTVIHDGRLLVFGGNHSGFTREGVYKVDCQTLEGDTLSLTVQPQMRQSHSCTLYNDCLYIYGGCIDRDVLFFQHYQQKLTSDLIQFKLTGPNPSWRKLQQKNPIPPRQSHLAVLIQKKFILVYGGSTPEENFLDQFWILDIQAVTWHQVKQIKGKLQARIGATMTPFGNQILSFGGQWGQGQDSHYSNDISKLRFQGDIKHQSIPALSISKFQVIGPKPTPRTGHSSVDYKGKLLIVMGGEGLTNKKTSILLNDIWAFDLRSYSWSELVIENRASFRPRANFTANHHKNTIYVFGGFINLSNFRCTDQLITLTLTENKHSHRQQNQHIVSVQVQTQNGNLSHYCSLCKFQFIPHQRQVTNIPEQHIPNTNYLISSTQNIIHAARSIGSPFEGLGLVINAISSLMPQQNKQIYIDLISQKVSNQYQQFSSVSSKEYLKIKVKSLILTKDELQKLVFSYKCDASDEGFDLKNGLFRVGKEVLICQVFQDGMLHAYFLTAQGVFRSVFHLQTIIYKLECRQHKLLGEFLNHYKINLQVIQPFNLTFYLGSITKEEDKTSQLKLSRTDLIYKLPQKDLTFKQFIRDYFFGQKKVSLKVNGENIPLISYQNLLRNHCTQRQQQPTTKYFSKVHLVINQHEEIINPPSTFIKIFALGRRVGVYNKFPFISGFLQLNDISSLNFPRTHCDSWSIKLALQQQIKSLLQESRKRESDVPLNELQLEKIN